MTDYLLHSIVWHCKIEKCKLMLNKTTVLIRTTNHHFRTKNIFENSKVFLVPCLHCTENHIFFFQTSWKVGLSKKITLEHDLSRIIGKDHVSLSRKHDLNLRQKMKDDLFQKNTRKYDILFGPPEKKVFSKRAAPGHDLSCIIWKDGIFFLENTIFFPWAGISRWPLSRNTWKYNIFCVHGWVLQTWCHAPLPKKNQEWPYPAKIKKKLSA